MIYNWKMEIAFKPTYKDHLEKTATIKRIGDIGDIHPTKYMEKQLIHLGG